MSKILCVCEKGYVRSVGTRLRLNRRGRRDVIAIGVRNTSPETLKMLVTWADKILVAEPWMIPELPSLDKVENDFTIGPDIYGNANNPELQQLIKGQLNKVGLR